jgi:hypothetical protein
MCRYPGDQISSAKRLVLLPLPPTDLQSGLFFLTGPSAGDRIGADSETFAQRRASNFRLGAICTQFKISPICGTSLAQNEKIDFGEFNLIE